MTLTFRTRLTIQYVITLGCLLGITAAGLLYALDRLAEQKFNAALWMVGVTEAENIVAGMHERGVARPDELVVSNNRYRQELGYDNRPLEKYVTVFDESHHAADFSENLTAPLPADDALLTRALAGETLYQTIRVSGVGPLRIVFLPVRGPSVEHPFIVVAGLPESFVGREIRNFNIVVALALITLVLLTSASAMLLAERAINPIEVIATATEQITARNLSARLPEPSTYDQIGRLARVFNSLLARLETAFDAQRGFTHRAAHELRTPLTILKGETQVTLRRRRTGAEYEDLLKSNLEEIDKLIIMIDGLLLLARYEGREIEVPQRSVRLDEIVMRVAASLQFLAVGKAIEMSVETCRVEIHGDSQAIERLVFNLVQNALTYTPSGGRVRIRVEGEGESARLVVEDNGIGIAAENLPHIFERFYRSHSAREMRPEGSGIGLSISRVIANAHDASLNVVSEPGVGTTFVVKFRH